MTRIGASDDGGFLRAFNGAVLSVADLGDELGGMETLSMRFSTNPNEEHVLKSPLKRPQPRSASPMTSGKRAKKVKSRSTRTGAVSARTRQALPSTADLFAAREIRGMTSPAKRKSPASPRSGGKARSSDTKLPTSSFPKMIRSDSFMRLNAQGELEHVAGSDARVDVSKPESVTDRDRAVSHELASVRDFGKVASASNREEAPVVVSKGKSVAEVGRRRVSLEPMSRGRNKPFENNSLYKPNKVFVGLHLIVRGAVEWCTNEHLHELCAPGAIVDISEKSLVAETRAAIAQSLRTQNNGASYPGFLRVKVMSHYVDESGWTLSTVQVIERRQSRKSGVELVFNLTEEAAYGCLRLFRSADAASTLAKKHAALDDKSPRTKDSGQAVQPGTPSREPSPVAVEKQIAVERVSGSSDDHISPHDAPDQDSSGIDDEQDRAQPAAASIECMELPSSRPSGADARVVREPLVPRDSQDRIESPRSGPAHVPKKPAPPSQAAGPAAIVSIGEVGGFEGRAPGSRPKEGLFDHGKGQLLEFYERLRERQHIESAPTPNQMSYARSPSMIPLSQAVHYTPPPVTAPYVSPTLYYLPVPISPLGPSGTITEAIVGGVRVRITQEPIDGWPQPHEIMAETAYHPMYQRTSHPAPVDFAGYTENHRAREREIAHANRVQPATHHRPQKRTDEDDDNLLAANLLMLKTSVAGPKRTKTPSASKTKKTQEPKPRKR